MFHPTAQAVSSMARPEVRDPFGKTWAPIERLEDT